LNKSKKNEINIKKAIEQLLMDKYYKTQKDKNIGFNKWSDGFEEWLEFNYLIEKNENK